MTKQLAVLFLKTNKAENQSFEKEQKSQKTQLSKNAEHLLKKDENMNTKKENSPQSVCLCRSHRLVADNYSIDANN